MIDSRISFRMRTFRLQLISRKFWSFFKIKIAEAQSIDSWKSFWWKCFCFGTFKISNVHPDVQNHHFSVWTLIFRNKISVHTTLRQKVQLNEKYKIKFEFGAYGTKVSLTISTTSTRCLSIISSSKGRAPLEG